ncbi:hypothetical protein DKX38_017625 [Salix brachista]|uniref:folate gamma-glutamyl hydrolase n=1 Tax=Salix brachista TaxID=2182728 RepID=A0A5N5KVT6_9ROSI|nr:hypothetical protein DKX38_017625 [Salix brachista]
MWTYLWIPFLMSLSKESTLARTATATTSSPSIPSCSAPDVKLNYRPVIGILSHPGDGASGRLNNATNASYIAASYVKFVESAGARVIPLIYNEPREILFEKRNLVNGVLFTGGWAKTGFYYDTVKAIFKEALAKNDAGFHFPVYAICLGFEILTMIISEDNQILETFNASDQASTLHFMNNINIEGTVFRSKIILLTVPSMLSHAKSSCEFRKLVVPLDFGCMYGISPQRFQENEYLSSFFEILTTSTADDNQVYVSTVQGCSYPVTAFQWHPEVLLYVLCIRDIVIFLQMHVLVGQYVRA